MFIVALLCSCW